MIIFEDGNYHVEKHIVENETADNPSHYRVVNKEHPEIVENATTSLYEAIRCAKIYNVLLQEAYEFVPETNWGRAAKDTANFINKGNAH